MAPIFAICLAFLPVVKTSRSAHDLLHLGRGVVTMSTSRKELYFYTSEGLALVKHAGGGASVLLRAADRALAQQDEGQSAIYAADVQSSVLRLIDRDSSCSMQYTAYGRDIEPSCGSVLRFNGQRKESVTSSYLLGHGYRAFSPFLMRFTAPDSFSPFGAGGINAYCYCGGDPVNRTDSSGHMFKFLFGRHKSRSGSSVSSVSKLPQQQPKPVVEVSAQPARQGNSAAKQFSMQINSVKGERFQDVLAYQGRETGAWLDEFSNRTLFKEADLPLVEGAKISVSRDAQNLVFDLKSNPMLDETDPRYIATTRLVNVLEKIETLEAEMKASLVRSS